MAGFSRILLHQRYPEAKSAALFGAAFDYQISTMRTNNCAGNRQSHSGPFADDPSLLPAIKLVKDMREVCFVDAGPVVFDFELESTPDASRTQDDATFGRRVARGVLYQVAKHSSK